MAELQKLGRRGFLKGTCAVASSVLVHSQSGALGFSLLQQAFGQSTQAIFYVDAIKGDDNNQGNAPSEAWKTVTKVNSMRFEPGTKILFKRGQTFNSGPLLPQDNGEVGRPIVYGSYGNAKFRPGIVHSKIIQTFSKVGTNIWVATLDGIGNNNEPLKIARDKRSRGILRGRRQELIAVKREGDFWHNVSKRLFYVFSIDDPSGVIEVPQSSALVQLRRNWITIQTLRFDLANDWCIEIGGSNLVIRRCTAMNASNSGMQTPSGDISNCLIDENEVFGCGGSGIQVNSTHTKDNFTIQRNKVHHNCLDIIDGRHDSLNYTGGIKVLVRGSGANMVIQDNDVWENGNIVKNLEVNSRQILKGAGIYVDTWTPGGAIVRYNRVYENVFAGIMLELTSDSIIFGNLVYRNGTGGDAIGAENGTVGISINRGSHRNRVFHNTVYNNEGAQISIHGPLSRLEFSNNNQVKNNILIPIGPTQLALRVFGVKKSDFNGNEVSHNYFGEERQGFIEWGSRLTARGPRTAPLDLQSEFEMKYTSDTSFGASETILTSNANFVNVANDDFHLRTGSSLAHAGDPNIGITHDIDGLEYGSPPSLGAHRAK